MLKEGKGFTRVIIKCGKTDLRRGPTGLAALVKLSYDLDPLEEGTLFLFCGTRKDRIKGIIYDEDGWCCITKRLTDGKYQWPRNTDEARDITGERFRRLMDGFMIDGSIRSIRKLSIDEDQCLDNTEKKGKQMVTK